MDAVRTVTGTAVPLPRSDVDTDQIIPAEWLKRVERTGFGEGCFEAWKKDPDFVLNKSCHQEASILLAGPLLALANAISGPFSLEDGIFNFTGKNAEAKADLQKLLELDPNSKYAKDAKEFLKENTETAAEITARHLR